MIDPQSVLSPLVEEVVDQVLKQYRIERDAARELIEVSFAESKPLQAACLRDPIPDKVRRTRAFKEAAAEAKKKVYYALRQYRPGEQQSSDAVERLRRLPNGDAAGRDSLVREIVSAHRSTSERLPAIEEFYSSLFSLIGEPRTILDVGCGVQPLLFPFDGLGRCVERYVALDKDSAAIDAVKAYAVHRGDGRLHASTGDIGSGWESLLADSPVKRFDAAFLFKLTPVVERQQREAMHVLAATPAVRWVVTGSCVGLAKRRDIERRERSSILRFLQSAGRRVVGEFAVGEEFGYAAE